MSHKSVLLGVSLALLASSAVILPACQEPSETGADEVEEKTGTASSALITVGDWTWHDVPGSICGAGQQTGYAISPPKNGNTNMLIVLDGGSLCWDKATCWTLNFIQAQAAASSNNIISQVGATTLTNNLTSYGLAQAFSTGWTGTTFQQIMGSGPFPFWSNPIVTGHLNAGPFSTSNSQNPYKDWTRVFVPYCTGDFHTGTHPMSFSDPTGTVPANFVGRTNLVKDLADIKATVANPSHVVLYGASAGGFGATFNFPLVASTFAPSVVDMITDSAPIFGNSVTSVMKTSGVGIWHTNDIIPANCAADGVSCTTDYSKMYKWYSTQYPSSKFAMVSNDMDPIIGTFLYLQAPWPFPPPLPSFSYTLDKFVRTTIAPLSNWRYFINDEFMHGVGDNLNRKATNRICTSWAAGTCVASYIDSTWVEYDQWLTAMQTNPSTWYNKNMIPHGVQTCTPSCASATCGDDGCGGSCGVCSIGSSCTAGSCSTVPAGTSGTIGRTDIMATGAQFGTGVIHSWMVTLQQPGYLSSITVYGKGSGNVVMGIYDDNGAYASSNQQPGMGGSARDNMIAPHAPGALIKQTSAVAPPATADWYSAPFTGDPLVLEPGTYWIAFMGSGSGWLRSNNFQSGSFFVSNQAYGTGTMPAIFPETSPGSGTATVNQGTNMVSIYATLTAGLN